MLDRTLRGIFAILFVIIPASVESVVTLFEENKRPVIDGTDGWYYVADDVLRSIWLSLKMGESGIEIMRTYKDVEYEEFDIVLIDEETSTVIFDQRTGEVMVPLRTTAIAYMAEHGKFIARQEGRYVYGVKDNTNID